jgi:ActR/RegA family two-component response regulator
MESAQIEKRIAALEEELAKLRSKVEGTTAVKPWWERIAGTFHDDPVYEEAMKLGRHYRRSLNRSPGKRKREP